MLPEGVAVCPSCYLYANWYGTGNARLYGKATDGPRPPFSAVVNVYDTSWHGQSFAPFGMYTSQPALNVQFDKRLPNGATAATRAAEMVWSYTAYGLPTSDPAVPLIVQK